MERRMETKEPTWVETMTQNGNGQGIRFLAASEQTLYEILRTLRRIART